ncbi:uncharacterized protein LOC110977256 [Acanthaster planci]|uniref:Uncharacterized protein LOC110977256 n=1 Tax=Acanthaster planci TaxID=133434 RepID=A0A8B7Y300_ACAPL|nr:uncharacterized protein LOC110977256 [Acanthaster planci]
MLAEYNIPFQSPRSLGEEPVFLGTDDDLFQLDIDLIHVRTEDTITLNGLQGSIGEDLDEACLRLAAEHTLQETATTTLGKVEAVFGSPGSDYLAGAYLTALHDQDDIGKSEAHLASEFLQSDLDLACSIELSDSDDSLAHSTLSDIASPGPSSPTAKRKKLCPQWSEMDSEERARELDLIMHAIADRASIREQLELLRLIGQDTTVLPSDSRFQIDAAIIDDEKLESVREYLNQLAFHRSEADAESCEEQCHTQREPRYKKTQERRAQHRANRKRRNKEWKQGLKEKRSGLFDQEVVLSLQMQDDEEEIDILD